MIYNCPRVIIAGANSGVGKTSVTLALVSALTKRGLRVQPFKVGPDYLDPTYLSRAAGRPCYNLDGWMTGKDYVKRLFMERTINADVAVIEGVMGLFDGADADNLSGSTAEIATWLQAPVILIVNAHGLARSIAPLVKGFAEFDAQVQVAGVIANHCGSQRHGEGLSDALTAAKLPELLGAIPRGAFPELPSRHLGLVTANQRIMSETVLDTLGDAIETNVLVERILEKARSVKPISESENEQKPVESVHHVRLGLAFDKAFHFYYSDNLEALEAHGCEIIRFSPLEDKSLPHAIDAIYIGGGYPEEYVQELATNDSMIRSIKNFAASDKPVYGECGGLMYLAQGIETRDGARHELVGLLPAWTRMLERLNSLGYVEATFTQNSLFGQKGMKLRGHEFHYSELINDPTEDPEWITTYSTMRRRSDQRLPEGFQCGKILVSYVHMHFASQPKAVEQFVKNCAGV